MHHSACNKNMLAVKVCMGFVFCIFVCVIVCIMGIRVTHHVMRVPLIFHSAVYLSVCKLCLRVCEFIILCVFR